MFFFMYVLALYIKIIQKKKSFFLLCLFDISTNEANRTYANMWNIFSSIFVTFSSSNKPVYWNQWAEVTENEIHK